MKHQYLDLFNQSGAKQHLLLDLNGIIEYAFDNTGLDWEEHGGQWLHLFFLCEKFIKDLLVRNARVDIIWFENDSKQHSTNNFLDVSIELAKKLLFQHVKSYFSSLEDTKVGCYSFLSRKSKEFSEFVRMQRPIGIFTSSREEVFMHYCLSKLFICVYTNIEFKGNSLFGFEHSLGSANNDVALEGYISDNNRIEEKETLILDDNSKLGICSKKLELFITICKDLIEDSESFFYSQIVIATILLQSTIPLQDRCQRLNVKFNGFNSYLLNVYSKLNKLNNLFDFFINNNEFKSLDLVDLFDGRLAHQLIALHLEKSNSSLLEFDWPEVLKEKWSQIISLLKDKIIKEETLTILGESCSKEFNYKFKSEKILPIEHSLISKLHVWNDNNVVEDSSKLPIFRDFYHWHNSVLLNHHSTISEWKRQRDLEQMKRMTSSIFKTHDTSDILVEPLLQVKEIVKKKPEKVTKLQVDLKEKSVLEEIESYVEKVKNHKTNNLKKIIEKQSQVFIKLSSEIYKIYHNLPSFIPQGTKDKMFDVFIQSLYLQIPPLDTKSMPSKENAFHINCWIRFIASYLEFVNYSENKKYFETLIDRALEYGFCATAECISMKFFKKSLKLQNQQDDLNPNELYLEYYDKMNQLPDIRLFTEFKGCEDIVDDLLKKKESLLSSFKSKQENEKVLCEQYRQNEIHLKLISNLQFVPDKWQKKVLRHIHDDKSLLVSVPTSNGKTFISYYIAEKMLRESDDSVICYVLPNKSLINQVYCELYNMFSKRNKNVVGMSTKESRINEFTCQILVIIPAMLEIYLLATGKEATEWKKKIKYLVLDEIHCIESDDSGATYEHLINLTDCPIIGLSATLGNLDQFSEWITKDSKRELEVVSYDHRYNPLEYNIYDSMSLGKIHPLAVLNPYKIIKSEIKNLQIFSLGECNQLRKDVESFGNEKLQTLFKENCNTGELKTDLLSPITWSDCKRYRKKHLKIIQDLVEENTEENKEILLKLFEVSRKSYKESYDKLKVYCSEQNIESNKFYNDNVISLVECLKREKKLSAIMFVFSKYSIDSSLKKLLDHLTDSNTHLWYSDEERDSALQEIEKTIHYFSTIDHKIEPEYIEALRVGVAAHYASLDGVYQKEIERLFRMRKLPFILATSTLALGINMPCRTVVIGGKSIYMSNVIFKQCCGRAGRRGYDHLGNVVLFGLSASTINRYLLSESPSLLGTNAITPSFVLRLFTSLNEADLERYAKKEQPLKETMINRIQRVIENPLSSVSMNKIENVSKKMKYYVRFAVEFLRQFELINQKGQPLQRTSIISHLFYQEPFNFMFLHLLQLNSKFKFFDHLIDKKTGTMDPQHALILFTHLFARNHTFKNKSQILPPLSVNFPACSKALTEYCENVLQIFSNFSSCYAKDNKEEISDYYLPLSGVSNFIIDKSLDVKTVPVVKNSVPEVKKEEEVKKNDSIDEITWDDSEDDVISWDDGDNEENVVPPPSNSDNLIVDNNNEIVTEKKEETIIIDSLRKLSNYPKIDCTSIFAGLSGNLDYEYNNAEHFIKTLKHTILLDKTMIPIEDIDSNSLDAVLIKFYSNANLEQLFKESSFSTMNSLFTYLENSIGDMKKVKSSIVNESLLPFFLSEDLESMTNHDILNNMADLIAERYSFHERAKTFAFALRRFQNMSMKVLFNWLNSNSLEMNLKKYFHVVNMSLTEKVSDRMLDKIVYLIVKDLTEKFHHPFLKGLQTLIKRFTQFLYPDRKFALKKNTKPIIRFEDSSESNQKKKSTWTTTKRDPEDEQ
ncbi:hypothetical protein ABK040_009218 [Willaertia magna]